MTAPLSIRPAAAQDVPALLEIYAPFVRSTAVSFEVDVPSREEFLARIEAGGALYPWLVAEDGGRVAGYAYAAGHRTRSAYQWSTEVSVYVAPTHLRRGVGRRLYERLFDELRVRGFANALAGIALPNEASVALHESLGFVPVGVYPKVGFKHGRWHDVGWWSLRLRELEDEPAPPGA